MFVYIGLEISAASTAVRVLREKGELATEAQVAIAPDAPVGFLRGLPQGVAALGLEAGSLSHRLHPGLSEAG